MRPLPPVLRPLAVLLPCLAAVGATWAAAVPTSAAQEPSAEQVEFFEREIRPLFVEHCSECHSERRRKPKAGLRLDTPEHFARGGESGAVVVPGDPDGSLLMLAVRYTDEELEMPPDYRLEDAEIEALERWIAMGAPYPGGDGALAPVVGEYDFAAGREHWAFQPMAQPAPPAVADEAWPAGDLDRFVLARLEAAGLRPAAEADRRTLIRRASYDLTGLPPTEGEVRAFLADDSPAAWAKVVDRLLASDHYGEQWGRHWLDVARYADSNGVDENLAFGHAWRYRDWVVRALNADLPYDEFLTMQLAGDLLPVAGAEADEQFDRLTATGFLQFSPRMLAEQDKEKLLMDVVDEQIDVASKAFLGVTVACARCHDHKFDPVPTADYYALAGVFRSTNSFANLNHVSAWNERPLETAAAAAARIAWQEQDGRLSKARAAALAAADANAKAALAGDVARALPLALPLAMAVIVQEAEEAAATNLRRDDAQWGTPETVVLHTAAQGTQYVEWEFDLPWRGAWELQVRAAAQESRPMRLLVDGVEVADAVLDGTTGGWLPEHQRWHGAGSWVLDAGLHRLRLERDGAVPHLDRVALVPRGEENAALNVVSLWAKQLAVARAEGDPLYAQLFALATDGDLDAATRTMAAAEDPRLRALAALPAPSSVAQVAERLQLAWTADGGAALFAPGAVYDLDAETRLLAAEQGLREAYERADRAAREHAAGQPGEPPVVMAVADGEARDVPVHVRGSHLALASAPTPRGFLRVVDHLVEQPSIAEGASGRLEFAQWLCDPEHPLTARVMVNRVWQGHFSRGLVDSPSNFGLRGAEPTHPLLLDWLARRFIASGWSLKTLHREILLSRTWRMSSLASAEVVAADPENRLWSRFARRRLSAEELRDSLLAASGELDRTVGGSLLTVGNRGYVTNDQSGNLVDYSSHRRALYLPVIRNAMYGMFATFDYADPSVPLERRPETTVASQALFLMNSPLVQQAAAQVAEACAPRGVEALYGRVLQRPPTSAESARMLEFLAAVPGDAGWQQAAQALLASNEFLYLD